MTLTDTKRALDEIGLRPTKSLGQNFLIDQNILRITIEAAELKAGESVLEIGAGLGALTQALLETGANVTAIEKDERLFRFLQQRFASRKRLSLVHADALTFDTRPSTLDAKLIANLPYSISTAILKQFVESQHPPRKMVLMLQREVGHRLAAKPGTSDYGLLTVFTQAKYRVRIRHVVSRHCFYPAPEIDSAVVVLDYQPLPLCSDDIGAVFSQVVHAGFGQRRKQFAKLLRHAGFGVEQIARAFATIRAPSDVRAESLSVEQFLLLAKELSRGRTL
jgi:16S rRNA (adenine1518-N6/adenine1519-N6)-dimethyltransferase